MKSGFSHLSSKYIFSRLILTFGLYCSNPNVIAYKDAFFDEDSSTLCIVMEFAGMGDLYEKIMEH